jgi:hypothetical protein
LFVFAGMSSGYIVTALEGTVAVTKGPGSRASARADLARHRRPRALACPQRARSVGASATFKKGLLVERPKRGRRVMNEP